MLIRIDDGLLPPATGDGHREQLAFVESALQRPSIFLLRPEGKTIGFFTADVEVGRNIVGRMGDGRRD
jgi:hypothetical protein